MAKLEDGSLLGTYRKGEEHFGDEGIVVTRKSLDGGGSWSSESTAAAESGLDTRGGSLAQLSDGRVALTYWVREIGGDQILNGARVQFSDDGGTTWDPPVVILDDMLYAQCAGPVVEHDGDLLIPLYGGVGTPSRRCKVVKSTDGGATWSVLSTMSDTSVESHEPNIVELSDGSLMGLIRHHDDHELALVYSTDHGATWTAPTVFLSEVLSRPSAIVLASGRVVLAYRDLTASQDTRLIYSDDDGVTWSTPEDPDATTSKQFLYAGFAETSPDTVGMFYAQLGTAAGSADVKFVRWVTP